MKKPFEVGERVRVYGAIGVGSSFCGNIVAVGPAGSIVTVQNGTEEFNVCRQQCRRLKPKKKKPVEARRVWVNKIIQKYKFYEPNVNHERGLGLQSDWVEFREVLPGETIVTREKLAAAWNPAWKGTAWGEQQLVGLAKRLGLPVEKGE